MSVFIRPLQLTRMLIERVKFVIMTPVVRRYLGRRTRDDHQQATFAVYFADVPSSAYQLEQWLHPFEALSDAVGAVALLIHNPVVARRISSQTKLSVQLADTSDLIERFVDDQGVRVIFYVNNNQSNFTTLRINGPVHVHLSHGESEKVSMYSNQLKAYDVVFVAGDASAERILARVPRFDPRHLVRIGRPQLHVPFPVRTHSAPPSPVTVLYAPTWEGDSNQMAYGSLVSHGEALVDRLVTDPRCRLVFRPHPKTGTVSRQHRAALSRVKRRLEMPAAARAGHVFDTSDDAVASIASADVVACDVSAIAMDALGMRKPLVLCGTGGTTLDGLAQHVRTWQGSLPGDPAGELLLLAEAPLSADQEAYRLQVFATGTPEESVRTFIEESARAASLSHND